MSKARTITMWVLTAIVGLMMIVAGAGKFGPDSFWISRFAGWGYAPWFVVVVGVAEVLGGIGLFIPKVSLLSAIGLVLVMLGAGATHLLNNEFGNSLAPLIYVALLAPIIFFRRQGAKGAR